jgi:hypothetical protein
MFFLCKSDGQICGIKNIIPYDVLQAIGFNGGGVWGRTFAMAKAQTLDEHSRIGGAPKLLDTFGYKSI